MLFILLAPPALLAWKAWAFVNPDAPALPRPINRIAAEWLALTFNFAAKITLGVAGGTPWPVRLAAMLVVWPTVMLFPSVLAGFFWFIHGARGWFGMRAAEVRKRKQLAALFCLQDGTGPDGIERYVHDDIAYAERVAVFLQHHMLRCPVPLYDEQGRYRFRCAGKAEVLAGEVVRAVSRARDNELYVIMADLAELGDSLEPLVKACRVARARRHHVMVIVPWPADVPSPDETPPATEPADEAGFKKKRRRRHPDDMDSHARHKRITKIVHDNLTRHYHESFRVMRRALAQAGATVMRVNDGDPVRLVLDRLDRLRGMRSRR